MNPSTMKTVNSPDVIIAGGGIIGVSIALQLRERGLQVLVLDRGEPGQEASSAAAGMLAARDPETPPALRTLALASARLYPGYVARLEELSNLKTDFRRQGTIAFPEHLPVPSDYRMLAPEEIQRVEPALRTGDRPAWFVQEDCVDPPLLMRAALAAAARSGIEIRSHSQVTQIRACGGDVEVTTTCGSLWAHTVIDCRGAWSGTPVKPRKGQSLYVQPQRPGLLEHVINAVEIYMVPRSSGKILVGATIEDAGFDKTVEPHVIARLHQAAAALVPELGSARIIDTWAGLRPGTPDDLPILGATETPGSFVATGHFRNGVLLAPVTAEIMANLCTGPAAGFDISAFSPLRFASASINSSRNSG
jgi:glycine oxidase